MNKLKKITAYALIVGLSIITLGNCFGKYALVRKVYGIHDSINVGSPLVTKIIKSGILWLVPVPQIIYGIAGFLDTIIFNLIEFWTDANPIGFNEYDKSGTYVKNLRSGDESLRFTYINYGERLVIDVKNKDKAATYIALRSEPGKFYVSNNGKLEEVQVQSQEVGSKLLLKMVRAGKVESSREIEKADYKKLEEKYSNIY